MPISYSPRSSQHHHNLRTYKDAMTSSRQARWNLLALLLLFLNDHLDCIAARVGAAPTHLAAVPSTRGRTGLHPLAALVGDRLDRPWISSTVNPRYSQGDREFHSDWFTPNLLNLRHPMHVLILEDTWTTGARAQSLAHALKTSGADTVATVVLGRHVGLGSNYAPAKRLLTAIASPVFDTTRCILDEPSKRRT
ncbi:phosphoribosyltransferase [Solwaraspora sp. WMMD791]|uniref:phosphoribosyltransferase n=1 Tax=Solwaraspora sp. WMMD791 TaxID=3016086 RepID=UPI00249A3CAB|nr:phosphoribosyltransferase [Solwaraspora sp. WMMD791]WFE25846.1 phosphoribosyltransferase [Solwaraspora sp. WMMD791]